MINLNLPYYKNALKEIADFYSFEDDPCSLESALHIALNNELYKIRRENVYSEKNSQYQDEGRRLSLS